MIRRISGTALTVILLSPHTAPGQETGGAGIASISNRAVVFVLDAEGTQHRGRFLHLDDQNLVILVGDDERRFKREAIARVERRGDSLQNGAFAGAVVGAAIGLLQAFTVARTDDVAVGIGVVALHTGIYAAIGTGLDAAVQGRTVVYRAWPTALVPERRGAKLAFSVRW